MDGSMLFYSALTAVAASIGLRRRPEVRVGAAVALGLMAITMFFANPFFVPDLPAVDGEGLLAILQHPAMIYHPPILYTGLVVLVVPFAATVTRAARGRSAWRQEIRPWVYLSWALLTLGMAFGANWAYIELGWGGFWAWDPVENTALMPWLALTVYLHSSRVEAASGRMRRASTLFASIPFALSVMGVYLTRSGATGSIHSFAEDPMVGRILLGAAVVVGVVVTWIAARSEPGEPWGRPVLDRDGWMAINTMLLAIALVFVTAGTAYPAFRSVFGGAQVVVDSRYFVITVLPVAVLVAMGIAASLKVPIIPWLTTTLVLLVAGLLAQGLHPGIVLIAPSVAAVLWIGYRLIESRPRRRARIAHLAHLGMAVLLVGVAGSSLGDDFAGSMRAGDQVSVAGHTVVLDDIDSGRGDRYIYVRAEFTVDGRPLMPEIRAYEDQPVPVAEPALMSGPAGDVIVAVSLLFPDGETVAVTVFVRPLVWLVWLGAGLIGLAGLLALLAPGGDAARRRRPATGEPRRAGTTTDTASR
jgi:cytochrome c-type biogenesis protein CcmF